MESILRDSDAEEAAATPKVGNAWYIPHHGVYHPRKPKKIRVVFDCSAKFEDSYGGKKGTLKGNPRNTACECIFFGGASSPGCANYGMNYLASKYEKDYPLAASFIRKNFYVDDGLVSVNSVEKANKLVNEAQEVLAKGKLRLHKFVSNNREVLSAIPESERASLVKDVI
ncbi:hypothetical protein QQF64_023781 [Cirrhinus molitorella]|uniref:Reverse transcriptase domain-containing protein n=1 Tax=Cirrhinus molitorella TaxID=172907 RepID=A0ABR3NJC5_9TELE